MCLAMAFLPLYQCKSTISSLVDAILPQDQSRLEQVLISGEPYDTLETAYQIATGAVALGSTPKTQKVS